MKNLIKQRNPHSTYSNQGSRLGCVVISMRFAMQLQGNFAKRFLCFCPGNLPTVRPSRQRRHFVVIFVVVILALSGVLLLSARPPHQKIVVLPPPPPTHPIATHHHHPRWPDPRTQIPLCNPRNFLAGNLRRTSSGTKGSGPVKISKRFVACGSSNIVGFHPTHPSGAAAAFFRLPLLLFALWSATPPTDPPSLLGTRWEGLYWEKS